MNELDKAQQMIEQIRQESGGVESTLNAVLDQAPQVKLISEAHDFIPDHLSNIVNDINQWTDALTNLVEEFVESGEERQEAIKEEMAELRKSINLNQGGRNLLTNLSANGYRLVSEDEDQILAAAQIQQTEAA